MDGKRLSDPTRFAPEPAVEPLETLPWWIVLVPLVPVASSYLVIAGGFVAHQGADPGFPENVEFLVMGVASVLVLAALFVWWDRETWRAAVPVRRPSIRELGAGVVGSGVAVGLLWPATNVAVAAIGFSPRTPAGASTTVGLVAVVFGVVIVAPLAEEMLFRGILFGYLLSRWGRISAAVGGSVLLFGIVHPGAAGVLFAVLSGLLLALLRIRYDNLVGAWLMHALVNVSAFVMAIGLLPATY
ncbi:lysostaphin resistance A-like protein [Natrarchaeobius sp. A-rgal3]|uniref:CPBP family intramembrane glutamic endopeptidase n=1 Tax=Natrarchaeobius versutus TaxID=1679078 RepID=UPI003510B9F3